MYLATGGTRIAGYTAAILDNFGPKSHMAGTVTRWPCSGMGDTWLAHPNETTAQ